MCRATRFFALMAAAAMLHCTDRIAGGTGVGNPPLAEVSLDVKAGSASGAAIAKASAGLQRNPDGSFTIRDSAGLPVTLLAIEALVQGIDFALPDSVDCARFKGIDCMDGESSVIGPFTVDLMSGKSQPPLTKIKLPAGLYRKIGFELISSGDSGETWDSAAQNIVIRGKLGTDSGAGRAFAVRLNLKEGLDFPHPTGIQIRADTLNNILLGLNVDGWLGGTELTKCVEAMPVDSSGSVLLQGDAFCGGVGKVIRRNIEGSGGLDQEWQSGP